MRYLHLLTVEVPGSPFITPIYKDSFVGLELYYEPTTQILMQFPSIGACIAFCKPENSASYLYNSDRLPALYKCD